jgi:hypothetical protein
MSRIYSGTIEYTDGSNNSKHTIVIRRGRVIKDENNILPNNEKAVLTTYSPFQIKIIEGTHDGTSINNTMLTFTASGSLNISRIS